MSTLTDDDLSQLLEEAAASYAVPDHGIDEVLDAIAIDPLRPPFVRRRWVQLSSAAAVIAAGAVFAAGQYGGGNGSSSSGTALPAAAKADRSLSYGKYAPSAGAASGGAAGSPGQAYTSLQSRTATTDSTKAMRDSLTPTSTTPGSLSRLAAPVPAAPTTAQVGAAPAADGGASRVVKTGTIALVVKDKQVSPTLTAVERAATAQGGYLSASSSDEYGDTPSGQVTIRVPVGSFEKLVAAVRTLDAKIATATTSGRDVTADYADLESQLRTLRATRERFLLILGQTKTISEILTVQQRVDDVSGQIDRIEGQRKLLASQSDLATLTVSVSEAGDPVVQATHKPRSGLSQAFVDAKNGFVSGVESIIRHSGGFLLFLICAGVVLLVARLGWRVARRRAV
jgi:hypothetical protein